MSGNDENTVLQLDLQKSERGVASVKREYPADSGDRILIIAVFLLAILTVEFFGFFTVPKYFGRGSHSYLDI